MAYVHWKKRCFLMKILEIHIKGFGIHNNLTINLSEKVNVILGDNESGKSTISTFIYTMLYGFDSNSNDKRKFYRPWNEQISYGGNILLECAGTVYKIDAVFGDTPSEDIVSLYNISADEKIEIPSDKSIGEILLGISRDAFLISSFATKNTIRISQDTSNKDELFNLLANKNVERKNSREDEIIIDRLNRAIEDIGSLEEETGKLGVLKDKKDAAEFSLSKIDRAKNEVLEKKAQVQRLEKDLSDIKLRQYSERNDSSTIANAVEVVSLHSEIKNYVGEINKLDDELSTAVKKSKKIRRPIDILYVVMMVLCFLSFVAIFFSNSLSNITFLSSFSNKLMQHANISTYILILIVAIFVSVWNMVLTYIFNKPVRSLSDSLSEKEAELFDLMGVEYYPGSKNRQYNRDNINIALEKHKNEYRFARMLLEEEDNKEKEDNFQSELIDDHRQKIDEVLCSIDDLEETISRSGSSDELQYIIDESSREINDYLKKKEALLIAKKVMLVAQDKWHLEATPFYVTDAGKLLNNLTDGKYDNIKLSRDFEISLENINSDVYSSASYGEATIDQMYLALRLSLVKVLSSGENVLPVILDDIFVHYDDKRKKSAYSVINNFSSDNSIQIIMTMCSKDALPEDFNIIKL